MSEGYFIGLGDKTTCGGKVLEGDNRINIFGVLHSCARDRVSCGVDGKTYQIIGGISHMESHGRLMAGTLDSFSGCPCRARLIPSVFTATYSNRSAATKAARRAAELAPSTETSSSAAKNSKLVDSKPAGNSPGSSSNPTVSLHACNHPDQMEDLASYIAKEMNHNIHDPTVSEMRRLIDYDVAEEIRKHMELPWYARLAGPPNFNSIAMAKKVAAAAIWTKKVGQGPHWDHKPKLRKLFPGVRHKQGRYDYYYDIWSNIHYGYVGIIGGLSESLLLDGAGAEQIASDSIRKADEMWSITKADWELPSPHPTASPWTEFRSWDDVADRVSSSIGVKLANQYPQGEITAQMVMGEVLAVAPENWGEGISVHVCK